MRRVVVVAFDGIQSLDVTGPAEAFSIATRFFGADYAIELATPDGAPARASSGLTLNADRAQAWIIMAAAGFVGGLVYWLIAGRNAGLRRPSHAPEQTLG